MAKNMSTNIPTTYPDFGLHDFIAESNFEQYLDHFIISDARSSVVEPVPVVADFGGGYVADVGHHSMIEDDEIERLLRVEIDSHFDDQQAELALDCPQINISDEDLFGFGHVDHNFVVGCGDDQLAQFMGNNALIGMDDFLQIGDGQLHQEYKDEDDEEDEDEDDNNDGSGSSSTTNPSKKGKSDRSRTLISERRRRGRMKDNLYALRALVPNITKMDKASIVGDAVLYVQNLQVKAKELKTEIAELEASVARQGLNGGKPSRKKSHVAAIRKIIPNTSIARFITKMDVFQVGEREFYIKMISNKGVGIAPYLYKALESLTSGFKVQSTNLTTVFDTYVLTFTLHVIRDGEMEMNVANLKLWLSRAITSQGFILKLSH